VIRAIMRRYYRRCDTIVVGQIYAAIMRAQRMNRDISIWARGVDAPNSIPASGI
jgi:hypothetical protein